ncbi:MAG: hypothetical protein OEZ06_24805 [Myxococcales bacterium]|nr:hypothetical protein [Myxococcales bacterium]
MIAKYLWTPLPAGASLDAATGAPKLKISVFVSPRLDPETDPPELNSFGANIGPNLNFTEFVQAVAMNFTFGVGAGAITLPATLANAGDGALDTSLWPLIFPPDTYVEPFQYQSHTAKTLLSFPVEAIHSYLMGLYEGLAQSTPTDFPGIDGSHSEIDRLFRLLGPIRRASHRIADANGRDASDSAVLAGLGMAGASAADAALALAFYRAFRFYNRRLHKMEPIEAPYPPKVPDFDFHRQIALLGDYPLLLRKLGVILDYEISDAGLTRLPTMDTVRAAFASRNTADHRFPPTYYSMDLVTPSFQAQPEPGSDLIAGMLDLGPRSAHFVAQTDVDGSALKLVEFAHAMQERRVMRSAWSEGKKESVPALRTGGISVVRRERGLPITARFVRSDGINAGIDSPTPADVENTPLYADDLVRGYRVDVEDQGQWRSLCQRDGIYDIDAGSVVLGPLSDEGYVKGASVSGESDEPDLAYLHETSFGWSGYSLVAPLPGRTLTMDKDPADPREQTPSYGRVDNAPPAGVHLQTAFEATPGTLPRLRYGRDYRVRARAVDLAGNGRSLSMPSEESAATDVLRYRRYEPIQQPILVYQHLLSEGEWLENLVIRSDRDMKVAEYIVAPQVAASGYLEFSQRHCAPPKVPQALAEAHGAFDPQWASEDQGTHYDSYLLALKEAGTFQDQEIFDPGMGGLVPVQNIQLIDTAMTPADKLGMWPAMRGESLAAGQYVIHTDKDVVLPYLPDPMATGLTLCDPASEKIWQREWLGSWPDLQCFRIRVLEDESGAEEPYIELDGDSVDVRLPQATIWKLRYSCYPKAEAIDSMAFYPAVQGDAAAEQAGFEGRHWMLTPYREITFVHAVQRPLTDPVAAVEQDTARGVGQTFARLSGKISCHGRSSSRLDVKAYFVDPVDFVTHDTPTTVFSEAHVTSLEPAYGQDEVPFVPAEHRHELGDTKHRKVVYQAVATTRYREYMPRELWVHSDAEITAREQVLDAPEMEGGDPSFIKDTVSVLSTARPDRPKIAYALPLFRWEKNEEGTEVVRRGGALRIYLERPWYSSGEGELLSVLLQPSSNASMPEEIAQFVSQWGSDPIRANLAPQNPLAPGHFLNRVTTATDLTTAEGVDGLTAVAFNVQFSTERKLWYTDIEFETGAAYFPFLRLSFARYQPESIDGVELSTTVRGEFIQVASNRSLLQSRQEINVVRISLTGTTGSNTSGNDEVPAPGSLQLVEPNLQATVVSPSPTPQVLPLIGAQPQPEVMRAAVTLPDDVSLPSLLPAGNNARGHVVLAHVERRTGDSDLDWELVGERLELPAYQKMSELDLVLWRGDLQLPRAAVDEPEEHRIVVEEYEVYRTDPDIAQASTDPRVGKTRLSGSRLVFAAHLAIPE